MLSQSRRAGHECATCPLTIDPLASPDAPLASPGDIRGYAGCPLRPPSPRKQEGLIAMLQRKPVFPHVIEINYQAGERLGCNVYLVFDGAEWVLIDIGYEETVDE